MEKYDFAHEQAFPKPCDLAASVSLVTSLVLAVPYCCNLSMLTDVERLDRRPGRGDLKTYIWGTGRS